MKTHNQRPAVLSPIYSPAIMGDYKPDEYIKDTMVKPLFVPQVQGAPVTITDSSNNKMGEDEVTKLIIDACQDTMNPNATNDFKSLFNQSLVYYPKNELTPHELFAVQAAASQKMCLPTPKILYTEHDVIMDAKAFLAGQCGHDKFFASLTFFARPRILGFSFVNSIAFDNFKTWLNAQLPTIQSKFSGNTTSLFTMFSNLTLDSLTEAIVLRNDDSENNEEFSFARLIIAFLMQYIGQVSSDEVNILPFNIAELYLPRSVIFVNIEKHAKATASQITTEWNLINRSLKTPTKIMSNNKLTKLTSVARNMQKIQTQAAIANNNLNNNNVRARAVHFRKTPPSTVDITKLITKIISKMSKVNKSDNTFKAVKTTYNKPNRRDPDDFNKAGKTVSIQYKPDIHIYLDTSGSISETNYESSVKSLIKMAKMLNVNLYFNSFSHYLSQCTHLKTRDKTTKQIYAQFQKVPKAYGGTDFEQIWNYIENSPKRKRELSVIITDFGYYANSYYTKHPNNLYYIPCSNMSWDEIKSMAESFYKTAVHNDPKLRNKILI